MQSIILNPKLYAALQKVFGVVRVASPGCEGSYSCPNFGTVGRNFKQFATVESWGEKYAVCCPICKETRFRLVFSYLWGQQTRSGSRKKPIYFSNRLYVCYNERCDLTAYFQKIREHMGEPLEVKLQVEPFIRYTRVGIELPKGCLPITHEDVPQYVIDYLAARKFSSEELEREFQVKYIPAGTLLWYQQDGSEFRLYEDRIFIPIIQGRKLVAWQLRDVTGKSKIKYLTLRDFRKSSSLYNYDNALMYPDIVICEGVTDVWRVGKQAVALFGKELSRGQLELMKVLWAFDGCAVVLVDADAQKESQRIANTLRRYKIFPRGVYELRLEQGDPADCEQNKLLDMLEQAGKQSDWRAERRKEDELTGRRKELPSYLLGWPKPSA